MSYDNIDWIRLRLLNQLVSAPDFLKTVLFPERFSGARPRWLFPEGPFVRSSELERKNALLAAIEFREIAVYERDPQYSGQYRELGAEDVVVSLGQLDREEDRSVVAALTTIGHRKWEDEFSPDWLRFWSADMRPKPNPRFPEPGTAVCIEAVYKGRKMLDVLEKWLPVYFALDPKFGLRMIDHTPCLGARFTFWKIMAEASCITWEARSLAGQAVAIRHMVPSLMANLYRKSSPLSSDVLLFASPAVQSMHHERTLAEASLCQFSDRWTIDINKSWNAPDFADPIRL